VAIAIALALHSEVLLADEPTSALDVTVQAELLELLRRAAKTHHLAVLLISHDLAVVSEIADRIAVMQSARLVEVGDTAKVVTNPQSPYTQQLVLAATELSAVSAKRAIGGRDA
jgi:ABC-type dipeptide/oligopeptide/nickel transport system ATPase component